MRRVAELVTSAVKIQVPASERVVNVILSEKNGLCNDSGVMLKKNMRILKKKKFLFK